MSPILATFMLIIGTAPTLARLGGPKKPPAPPPQPYGLSLWLSQEVFANRTASDEGFGYFLGNITIGGQDVRMLFDLTADRSWVISTDCETASCQEHSRYKAPAGSGVTDSMQMSTDTGDETDTIFGNVVSDRVCVGRRLPVGNESRPDEAACAEISLLAVTEIDEGLIVRQHFDGIIGLTNPAASKREEQSFLGTLNLAGLPHQFGFYVSDSGWNAELLFGGYDKRRLEADSEISWVPVVQDNQGFWMIHVRGIRVGGRNLGLCKSRKGCHGLLQIGTPTISMHEDTLSSVQRQIGKPSLGDGCQLPAISFDLEGGHSLTLEVEDYVGSHCAPELRGHTWSDTKFGAEVLILGEPIFRRYYTVFDWERRRMGFGRAKVERHCGRLGRAGLPVQDCVETEEVILFQTEVKWDEL